LAEHGLNAEEHITFEDEAIQAIIRGYTREAGVRNVEREIASVCRKVTREFAEGRTERAVINEERIGEYLGAPRFLHEEVKDRTSEPGVAIGLAWTPTGGEVLFVEATRMDGGKTLTLTGQLGDVMKESAQAALSYVRSHAKELGIAPDFYKKSDLHLHVPAGAIPKDGPSAGVTMTTAIVSLLTGRRVKGDIAMTGEITLLGKVLPIGGIKEKSLAARRAGLTTIILPEENRKDIMENLSEEIRQEMTFVYVRNVAQVLEAALEPKGQVEG
jgi:ATP-dependent Lon protease